MVSYLEIAREARYDSRAREADTASVCGGLERTGDERGREVLTHRDESDQSDQSPRAARRERSLTVGEALEEMGRPRSGPGLQARLYRGSAITREDAIRWITCAIVHRRMGVKARAAALARWEEQKKSQRKGRGSEPVFFAGWERHALAVQEALDRFCGVERAKAGLLDSAGFLAGNAVSSRAIRGTEPA